MTRFTYDGLRFALERIFNGIIIYECLMDETDTLTESDAIEEYIALEARNDFGYQRKVFTPGNFTDDTVNQAVVSDASSNLQTAGASTPFSYDSIMLLASAGQRANVLVDSISGQTVTTTNAHELSVNDKIITTDATVFPSNMSDKGILYVTSVPSTTTFQAATTEGGTPVTFGSSFTGELLIRHANGVIIQWDRRQGTGDVSFQIGAGASYTTRFRAGMKVAPLVSA